MTQLAPPLIAPDHLQRQVLVAAELFDPVAQALVSSGVTVTARGLTGQPIVNWSGRFVWLREQNRWPEAITVRPNRLPFEPADVPTPRPPNFPDATPQERRVRIVLRPTSAYDFTGVTAIRGRLLQTADPASAPIAGVAVRLQWRDLDSNTWRPAETPLDPVTDRHGQFAAFLRLNRQGAEEPDVQKGRLAVRLAFTRTDPILDTRATPENFPFTPEPAHRGRVLEGVPLDRDVIVGWSDLLI